MNDYRPAAAGYRTRLTDLLGIFSSPPEKKKWNKKAYKGSGGALSLPKRYFSFCDSYTRRNLCLIIPSNLTGAGKSRSKASKETPSVILDTTFLKERKETRDFSDQMNVPFFMIGVICPEKEVKKRLFD